MAKFIPAPEGPPTCKDPAMHAKFAERGIEDQCPHCIVGACPERVDIVRTPVPVGYKVCPDCGRWPEYCRC